MDFIFLTGIAGGITLVVGAMLPAKKVKNPITSPKNLAFGIGGLLMLIFSVLDFYFNSAPFFFVILQILVNISTILMFANTDDRLDAKILTTAGAGCVFWSIFLFQDFSTIFFILGLLGIGLGYAFDTGSFRRNFSLFLGSVLIAIFSFIGESWIFFWLNLFFAVFSGFHSVKLWRA